MSRPAAVPVAPVGWVFAGNGLLFASLVSRVPDLRSGLDLDNGTLGLLLLAIAAGSLVGLPVSGALVARFGAASVVRSAATLVTVGLVVAGLGAGAGTVVLAACGLFGYGLGTGAWDVAMNVEGAEVERRLGRTVMPRFHAGFSLGTVAGALVGVAAVAGDVPMAWHLGVLSVVVLASVVAAVTRFLPIADHDETTTRAASAWREPRTLVIGLVVLSFAVAEGSANDWLALALVDGYDVAHWQGVAGFSLFVAAMTTGRMAGPLALDRWGRAPTLWATAGLVAAGLLLVVYGEGAPLVVLGIVAWGLGSSLGFPVGMSAAADDPAGAAARVAVVSTIGYSAFLAGPPLLGALGDQVGTLEALLAVVVLMAPASLAVPAARRRERVSG